MLVMACPACVRFAQAWYELAEASWNIFGTVRMPLLPSAWHDWQAFLTVATHCSCVFMFSLMRFALSPVPGNLLLSGILSSEYQYKPGQYSAAAFALGAATALRLRDFPDAVFAFFESPRA